MRIKNRYIIAQHISTGPHQASLTQLEQSNLLMKDFHLALKNKITELFGEIGAGEFGNNTMVKYYDNSYTKLLVVRTTRKDEEKVLLALSCLTKVKEVDLVIRCLRISSCFRTCLDSLKSLIGTFLSFHFDSQIYGNTLNNSNKEGENVKIISEEEKQKILQSYESSLQFLEL